MQDIELKIRELLLVTQKPLEVKEAVLSFLTIENLNFEHKRRLMVLLFNLGLYTTVLEESLKSLKNKDDIFWGLLTETLCLNKITLHENIKKYILKGAYKNKQLDLLALSEKASHWGGLFQKNRERNFEFFEKAYQKSKKKIIQKIKSYLDTGKTEDSLKFIEKELAQDPENKTLIHEYSKVKNLIAEDIFDRFKYNSLEKTHINQKVEIEGEPTTLKVLRKEAQDLLKKNPEAYRDMAFFFYFIEDHESVLSILKDSKKKTLSSDWLRLETLLLFEKYLDALEEIKKIEKKYSLEETDIFLASHYIKALCYWGLKEKEKAIEALKELLKVKPGYRSAHALLSKWEALL